MAKGSEIRAQKNKENIIKAALSLFQSQGIRKVSVSDIAAKSGVSLATVYNHFGTKDELVREAGIAWYKDILAEYTAVLLQGPTFAEKFGNLIRFKTNVAGKTHGEFALFVSSDDPYIRHFLETEYMEDLTAMLNRFFQEGREQGVINPDLKTETILRYMELIRKGLNAEGELAENAEYAETLLNELTPIVLYGILGRKPE